MNRELGLFKTLLNNSDTGIIVHDIGTGEILFISENAARIFANAKACDLIGSSFVRFVESNMEAGRLRLSEKMLSGKEYEIREYPDLYGKCWRICGKKIEQDGHIRIAHYFYDVTDQYHGKESTRSGYYTELSMLSNVSPYRHAVYRMNLTQNSMSSPLGNLPEGIEFLQPMGIDALFGFLASHCGTEGDRKRFASLFNRQFLLKQFEDGNIHFFLEHTFYQEISRRTWITSSLLMRRNTETNDVEAILCTFDIFRERVLEGLLGSVSENDYDGIYLIDTANSRAYGLSDIRRHPRHDLRDDGIEYRQLIDRQLARIPKNSDGYLEVFEMLTLENIRRELRSRPNYTVYFDSADAKGMMRHKKSSFCMIDGSAELICNTVQDISGVVENALERENEMRRALHNVQNALHARDKILHRLNRDIRSPLSSIIGMAETVRSETADPADQDYLTDIIIAGSSIRSIIDDILDLHQIEQRGVVLMPEHVDLTELFGSLEARLLPVASERGLNFSVEVDNHVPRQVMADRCRLEQLLCCLIENTFCYNANGESVRLLITEKRREYNRTTLKFSISDTSTGSNADYLSSVFEPVDPKIIIDAESPDRLDLYLTFAKRNVSAMGGKITAESTAGEGTCVTVEITFPVFGERDETFRKSDTGERTAYWFPEKRVLLVDDHKISLQIGEKMLRKSGADVETAMNGEEAVEKYRKEKGNFDLIFMDIHMPLMDGFEATRKIRGEKAIGGDQVPIVALTANAYEEDVQLSFDAGMNGHLSKPFGPVELYRTMAKFIED